MIDRKNRTNTISMALRLLGVVLITAAIAGGMFGLGSAVLKHFGLMAKGPAIEFEIRLPTTAARDDVRRDAQVELLTDQNQTLASLDDALLTTGDGRAVLRGQVPLRFRTSERMVVLSLPGQAQRAFRLRLPPSPSPSQDFGPWHMTDRVMSIGRTATTGNAPDDSYAIRYRVL